MIDFGLAKLLRPISVLDSGDDTPRRGQSDPGRIIGTAAYMSPEQVRGAQVDARSDVFSLGATLHEMISGRPPFRRETGVETLHAVLKEPAPRLADLGVVGPALELQPVIDRCLEKEPKRRYALMADLIADLETVGLGSAGAGSSATSSTSRFPAPRAALRVLVVDDEDPGPRPSRRIPPGRARRRARRRMQERLRGGEGGLRVEARPGVPRHPDAQARRIRGPRAHRPRGRASCS